MNIVIVELIVSTISILFTVLFLVRAIRRNKDYFSKAEELEIDMRAKSMTRKVTILEFAKLQRLRSSLCRRNCFAMVCSVATIFFPIWFLCTSVKVVYGAQLDLCSNYNCDCLTQTMFVNNSLQVQCESVCKNCKQLQLPGHEVKCACNSDVSATCVIPCNGTSQYGTVVTKPKFSTLQCMIVNDVYVYEETQCYKVFGNEIPNACRKGYSCFWDETGVDKCSTYCAWGKSVSRTTWSYRGSITTVDIFEGFDVNVISNYSYVQYTKYSMNACRGKFAVVNGEAYCIDEISDLPDWIKCTSQWTWTNADLEEFVRQYAPAQQKCDAETHYYPTEARHIVYPSQCTAKVTFTGLPACTNEEIPLCTNGFYTYNTETGAVWITYSQYCRTADSGNLQMVVQEASSTTDTSGCNLDCTWTRGYGTGLNKSCIAAIPQTKGQETKDFKDTLFNNTMKYSFRIVFILIAVIGLVGLLYCLYNLIKFGLYQYKLRVDIPDPIISAKVKEHPNNGHFIVKYD